jgi:hypothetical protein
VQISPLAWLIGRFGLDFEALVASHHGMTGTLHGDAIAGGNGGTIFSTGGGPYTGFGGELGWHIYALPGELRGWWMGPSAVFGVYENGPTAGPSSTFSQIGVAIDMGARFGRGGFAFDIGGGVQVVHLSNPGQWTDTVRLIDAQVRPRILLALGYCF